MARLILDREQLNECAQQAQYRVDAFALLLKIPPWTLRRRFRIEVGSAPESWLKEQRLIAAERLLLAGKTVKEVAGDLGYRDATLFCHQFKNRNHITPGQFVELQATAKRVLGAPQ